MRNHVRIIGTGMTALNPTPRWTASEHMIAALKAALGDAGVTLSDVNGLIAIPSLTAPNHFMQVGHHMPVTAPDHACLSARISAVNSCWGLMQ